MNKKNFEYEGYEGIVKEIKYKHECFLDDIIYIMFKYILETSLLVGCLFGLLKLKKFF